MSKHHKLARINKIRQEQIHLESVIEKAKAKHISNHELIKVLYGKAQIGNLERPDEHSEYSESKCIDY